MFMIFTCINKIYLKNKKLFLNYLFYIIINYINYIYLYCTIKDNLKKAYLVLKLGFNYGIIA